MSSMLFLLPLGFAMPFHAVLKHTDPMVGFDLHIPWPPGFPEPLPYPVGYYVGLHLYGTGLSAMYAPKCLTAGGAWTMQRGTDIGTGIPHVGLPSLLTPLDVLFSTSVSLFGASNVLVEGEAVAAALYAYFDLSMNCSDYTPLYHGLVFAFNTHVVGMHPLDILFGFLAALVMIAISAVVALVPVVGEAVWKRVKGPVQKAASKYATKVALREIAENVGKSTAKAVAREAAQESGEAVGKAASRRMAREFSEEAAEGLRARLVRWASETVSDYARRLSNYSKQMYARGQDSLEAWVTKQLNKPAQTAGEQFMSNLGTKYAVGAAKYLAFDPFNTNADWLGFQSPLGGKLGGGISTMRTLGVEDWFSEQITGKTKDDA